MHLPYSSLSAADHPHQEYVCELAFARPQWYEDRLLEGMCRGTSF